MSLQRCGRQIQPSSPDAKHSSGHCDVPTLHSLIQEMAEYEHLRLLITEQILMNDGFGVQTKFRVLIAEFGGNPAWVRLLLRFVFDIPTATKRPMTILSGGLAPLAPDSHPIVLDRLVCPKVKNIARRGTQRLQNSLLPRSLQYRSVHSHRHHDEPHNYCDTNHHANEVSQKADATNGQERSELPLVQMKYFGILSRQSFTSDCARAG